MYMILAIASGGALGAVLRHFVGSASLKLAGTEFPWGILSVNVIGSFIMGALITYMALAWSPSQEVKAFLTVGLLGGFTTFSAFSLDVITLWERGASMAATSYIMASILLSIFALLMGMSIVRAVLL